MKYLIILLCLVAVGFLVWKAFVQNSRKDLEKSERERESLLKQVQDLSRRLDEKDNSRINVVGLSPILHLAILNIDSSFTRTYVREDAENGITFNGALRADICAEYGVKLEEMGFRYDPQTSSLMLSNFHPGLISYSKKQLTWDIAKSFRSHSLLGHEFPPVSDSAAEAFTKKMCNDLRTDLEKEIDSRKIDEFEWLSPMISQQVMDMFKLLLGKPELNIIAVEGEGEGEYLDFQSFRKLLSAAPEPDNQ